MAPFETAVDDTHHVLVFSEPMFIRDRRTVVLMLPDHLSVSQALGQLPRHLSIFQILYDFDSLMDILLLGSVSFASCTIFPFPQLRTGRGSSLIFDHVDSFSHSAPASAGPFRTIHLSALIAHYCIYATYPGSRPALKTFAYVHDVILVLLTGTNHYTVHSSRKRPSRGCLRSHDQQVRLREPRSVGHLPDSNPK